MLTREQFIQYTQEALEHLHDPVHLQTSALGKAFDLDIGSATTTARALRTALLDSIESLRPDSALPPDRPEWIAYRLLSSRYVEDASRFNICNDLGLSQATYYRLCHDAVNAVADVLWKRYRFQVQAGALQPDVQAREQAIQLARESSSVRLDMPQLLSDLYELLSPLASQQGLRLSMKLPETWPPVYGDPIVLRQILLNILTESLKLAAPGDLCLMASVQAGEIRWGVWGIDPSRFKQADWEQITGFVVARGLLEVSGGTLSANAQGQPLITFTTLLARPRSVLVIDDDQNMARLFCRYLEFNGYLVHKAGSAQEAWDVLAATRPDAILLDVLIPREDGWGILQRLRISQETADIPVIVCSVLDQAQLAISLGASQVLRKPITEAMLLEALEALLDCPDSSAKALPA